jgi:bifunctional DNA-binding transcriptional regulator/antitoxin component of YhaV-PrlF toxin-antitoxin module
MILAAILMTTVVKSKAPIMVPPSVQRRAGIAPGDRVEIKTIRGVITIVGTPEAMEEYTPSQRRVIAAQLAEGLKDVRHGRVSRRFDTVNEMLASMRSARKKSVRPKTRAR